MTVIRHEIKMNLKNLLIWSFTIGISCFAFLMMFPSLKDTMEDMADAYANMGGFSAAFGMDQLNIATITGFFATEVGAVFCIGSSMFAAMVGIDLLAKEEGNHTAEFLMTLPQSRIMICIKKWVAMVLIFVLFYVIAGGVTCAAFLFIDDKIDFSIVLLYYIAQFLMQIEIGTIAFGLSAFLKKSSIGLGIGFAIVLYMLQLMAKIIPDLENMKYVTPFYYSDCTTIFVKEGIDWKLAGIGILIAAVLMFIGCYKYHKKDIVA